MIDEKIDHGIQILVKILHMKGLKNYENLLKQCYEIQKKFQYETERNTPLVLMKKLIEEEISKKYEEKKGEAKK